MPLPYPVPESVEAVAASLIGELERHITTTTTSVYVLEILDARGDVVHASPELTHLGLRGYLYEFNYPFPVPGWRTRLTLSQVYRGELFSVSRTFDPDGLTIDTKGVGATVKVSGRGKAERRTANDLRTSLSRKIKSSRAAREKSSSSTTLRPNESETQFETKIFWLKSNFGAPWQEFPSQTSYIKRQRQWTGVRTPGYGSLRTSQLPVNPHTVSMRNTLDWPAISASYNVVNGSASGNLERYTAHYAGATLPVHISQADAKALKRLAEHGQVDLEANIAQDFAQIGQSLRLVSHSVSRITGALQSVKRGNLPEAAASLFRGSKPRYRRHGGPSVAKSIADNWLELQYGWKPLINDVHGTLRALSNLNIGVGHVTRTVSSGKATSESKVPITVWNRATVQAGSKTISTQSTVRYTLYWGVHDYLKAFLAQLGFTNPVNLAWEIIPFSFVADWFLPIGPYLEQLSAWDGLYFVEGSKTQFTRQKTTSAISYAAVDPFNANARIFGSGTYRDEWIILNRSKLTSFPGPVLPSFKNGLNSVTHVAAAVALLVSSFAR